MSRPAPPGSTHIEDLSYFEETLEA